jgi:hypothetical protein
VPNWQAGFITSHRAAIAGRLFPSTIKTSELIDPTGWSLRALQPALKRILRDNESWLETPDANLASGMRQLSFRPPTVAHPWSAEAYTTTASTAPTCSTNATSPIRSAASG